MLDHVDARSYPLYEVISQSCSGSKAKLPQLPTGEIQEEMTTRGLASTAFGPVPDQRGSDRSWGRHKPAGSMRARGVGCGTQRCVWARFLAHLASSYAC
jgi:hypothetical protein